MEFDKELETIRVYQKNFDKNWVGSIQLPDEIKHQIQKYLLKFTNFENQITTKDTDEIPGEFKNFMKILFEELEKEISSENHQKNMAQTQNTVHIVQPLKKIEIKSIMSQIYLKLKKLIKKEEKNLDLENFKTEDLLSEKNFQSLKENTIKILKLLDISDFKERPGYKKLKHLLLNYMIEDTSTRPRLSKKNCLIIFKKLLLKQLELKS